jgi:uncharacterized protein YndB with AHSA1/START domain
MIAKILLGVGVVIALVLIIAAFQPSDFRVERSTVIAAPAAVVFAQVNDFHRWVAWSPWEKIDPAMKKTFDGAPAGTGAIYSWAGNNQVGEGRCTIIESRPNELIRVRLDFIKPFASVCTADYAFKQDGERTQVTWSMSGPKNFISKLIGLFMSMDKMLGEQFEAGLSNLKTVSEMAARKQPA